MKHLPGSVGIFPYSGSNQIIDVSMQRQRAERVSLIYTAPSFRTGFKVDLVINDALEVFVPRSHNSHSSAVPPTGDILVDVQLGLHQKPTCNGKIYDLHLDGLQLSPEQSPARTLGCRRSGRRRLLTNCRLPFYWCLTLKPVWDS